MIRKYGRCHPIANIPDPVDWAGVFDGGIYVLEMNVDFDCSPKAFAVIVIDKAKRTGVVSLNIDISESCVVVQAPKGG